MKDGLVELLVKALCLLKIKHKRVIGKISDSTLYV
jgi:hypothetical protein